MFVYYDFKFLKTVVYVTTHAVTYSRQCWKQVSTPGDIIYMRKMVKDINVLWLQAVAQRLRTISSFSVASS